MFGLQFSFEFPYMFWQKAVVVQAAVRLHGCRVPLMLRSGLNKVVKTVHELVILFFLGCIGILSFSGVFEEAAKRTRRPKDL